jgi:hypothetical protein
MEILTVRTHVGSDGILKLELPVGATDVDCEVTIRIQPPPLTREEWKAFIDATAGSLADDPIERGDQGTPEVRDEVL